MTDKQKSEIQLLRKQGYGYKKISAQTGINVNTVKSYCRKLESDIPKCIVCGNPLTGKQKKFCSISCKNKWWNSHPDHDHGEVRTCSCCSQPFHYVPSKPHKFCSHACYIKSRFGTESVHD